MVSLDAFISACRQARETGGNVRINQSGVPCHTTSRMPRFMAMLVRWFKDRYAPEKAVRQYEEVTKELNAYIESNSLQPGSEVSRIRHSSGRQAFLNDLDGYLRQVKQVKDERTRIIAWRSYFDTLDAMRRPDKADVNGLERRENFENFCRSIHARGRYNDDSGELHFRYITSAYEMSAHAPENIKGKTFKLKSLRSIPKGECLTLVNDYHKIARQDTETKL